ncbi:MAG: hypothetical protein IKJ05_00195 [Oscillospiraceae bacterium]|nr:hypothetical protein [Oscillospiraceae bacterium]
MDNIEKEIIVRKFTEKRALLRKICFASTFALLAYAVTMQKLFPFEIGGEYKKAYTISVVLWIMLDSFLSHYIANDLSVCPVCHIHIPTGTPRHGNRDRKITGNGPLPPECPYCGTEFEIRF